METSRSVLHCFLSLQRKSFEFNLLTHCRTNADEAIASSIQRAEQMEHIHRQCVGEEAGTEAMFHGFIRISIKSLFKSKSNPKKYHNTRTPVLLSMSMARERMFSTIPLHPGTCVCHLHKSTSRSPQVIDSVWCFFWTHMSAVLPPPHAELWLAASGDLIICVTTLFLPKMGWCVCARPLPAVSELHLNTTSELKQCSWTTQRLQRCSPCAFSSPGFKTHCFICKYGFYFCVSGWRSFRRNTFDDLSLSHTPKTLPVPQIYGFSKICPFLPKNSPPSNKSTLQVQVNYILLLPSKIRPANKIRPSSLTHPYAFTIHAQNKYTFSSPKSTLQRCNMPVLTPPSKSAPSILPFITHQIYTSFLKLPCLRFYRKYTLPCENRPPSLPVSTCTLYFSQICPTTVRLACLASLIPTRSLFSRSKRCFLDNYTGFTPYWEIKHKAGALLETEPDRQPG